LDLAGVAYKLTIMFLIRIWCGVLDFIALLHSILGQGIYRWGFYDIEDDSDIPISRRIGRIWEAAVGVALILGAILFDGSKWLEWL